MWIRSQDKTELIDTKGKRVFVLKETIRVDLCLPSGDEVSEIIMGDYETRERALKVLDQIQDQLVEGVKHDDIIKGRRHQRNFVFQMPQV